MYCTSCVMLVSLVEIPSFVLAYRTFAYYSMNAVRFVVAPLSTQWGGGGLANTDSQNRSGALLGSSRGYILPAGVG
jgi:hypothetical protein